MFHTVRPTYSGGETAYRLRLLPISLLHEASPLGRLEVKVDGIHFYAA
jgi:hypothetical protein